MRIIAFARSMRYSVFVGLLACAALINPATAGATAGSGAIQGKVTEASSPHSPVSHVSVRVFQAGIDFAPPAFAETNAEGEYAVTGLEPGFYYVEFRPEFTLNLVVQFWEGKSSFALATPVAIESEGQIRMGVDAELEEGSVIEGKLTESNGEPVAQGDVIAWLAGGDTFEPSGEALTGRDGTYRIVGLPTGVYRVVYQPPVRPLPQLNLVIQERTLLLNAKETVESNVTLPTGGVISGRVVDAATHDPVDDAIVNAYPADPEVFGGSALSNERGEYAVLGLGSGTYELEVSDVGEDEYITQFDGGIGVTQGGVTPGINISLVPQLPANTSLPSVSGTPQLGQTLSCADGSWLGLSPIAYSQRWLRDGSAIEGATANTYAVQTADLGHGLSCEVMASNRKGHVSAKSNPLQVPLPLVSPPPRPVPPAVTLGSSLVVVIGGSARVPLSCAAPLPCAGTVELTRQVVVKHRKHHRLVTSRHTIILGIASYTLAAGQTKLLVIRLSKSALHELDATRHRRQLIVVTVSVHGGSQLSRPSVLMQAPVRRKGKR